MAKTPTQRRSRERVERILQIASDLISERGSDAMRMSDVAAGAGVSIGSLYQYFPDKSAILRALADRYQSAGRACIDAELSVVHDLVGLREAFGRLIDNYYGIFLAEPVIRDIWTGTQADPSLRALELEDSRANGVVLAAAMARVRSGVDPVALAHSAFLVMQLGEATMRLAVSVPRSEGDALVETFKRMALREIAGD